MSDELKYKNNDLMSFRVDTTSPEGAWKEVQKHCSFLSNWGVKTLREGLDGFVQSIVLEPYYNCKDHRNLYSNFYSKKFLEVTSNCQRLHFFADAEVGAKALVAEETAFKNGYLGFSVIRPVHQRCLGRTVIDPYRIGKGIKEHYYLLRTLFRAQINGTVFPVMGYPFTAQDTDATLCAHSALWGVCRYLSERYPHYRELYPYDFIRMTESSKGRAVPYRGMTYTDYCKILTEFGTYPVYRFLQKTDSKGAVNFDAEAFQDLYSYVESGFPVLASLSLPSGRRHVVSIVGHTLDCKKTVVNTSGLVDSSHFLKQFVVVDDNCFPYQTLGYADDMENYAAMYEKENEKVGIEQIITMTCPLPEKVFLPAKNAREKALMHCDKFLSTLKLTGNEPFVMRLFVTSSSAFKRRKLEFAKLGPDRAAAVVTNLHLPHFVWLMELSPVEIYRQGLCTAEVLMDATAGTKEDGMIYIRIGKKIFLAGDKSAKYLEIADAPLRFPQYTHNLGEKEMWAGEATAASVAPAI
jgi:hypothetical protein